MQTQERNFLTPDYRDFDKWVLNQARTLNPPMMPSGGGFGYRHRDRLMVELARHQRRVVGGEQNFGSQLSGGLIVPQSAVSPGTTPTFILSQNQANAYWPLPYGPNKPSVGQLFRFVMAGLHTSVAGTFIFNVYHGPGTSATAGGTALGASQTLTQTAYSAGFFLIEGWLQYRTISETATTSSVWCQWRLTTGGPAANTATSLVYTSGTAAAVSVDTTGQTAGAFGALNLFVSPNTTASSFTPEMAFIYGF